MFTAKGFVQCKQSDPQFQQCAASAVTAAVPELVKGNTTYIQVPNYLT